MNWEGGRNVTFALCLLQSICLILAFACLLQVVPVEEAAMSTLYPSLEDMKVDQTLQAQANAAARALAGVAEKSEPATAPPVLYPNLTELGDYMGLSLSSEEVQKDLALVPASGNQAGALVPSSQGVLVAPLTGNNLGLRRAEIRPGLRELHLCKDERGKTGLQLKSIDQGVFVQLVKANSPASLVGLRFGDQVLQINGKDCAGWSTDKANRALKKAAPEKIVVIVRDRPFQRTVTMHKDSTGHVGFVIKKGKIVSLTKGSSAARNGLLINHYICELNGQNVIGLKDKQILDILVTAGNAVTITIIPTVIYEHMVKRLSPGQIKSSMDHSLPDA
uniref:Syndecan binding protein 2 n=2 Tax=Emydidae TaxID=8476 RepID=A0A8C3IV87_CHRPI